MSRRGPRTSWGPRRWPHFRPREFGGPIDEDLLDLLERLRSRIGGKPIQILSGWRSEAHNAAVGGVQDSQHLYGRAADIPAGLVTPEEAIMCGATGVGERDGWAVHVDVRPGELARWTYA